MSQEPIPIKLVVVGDGSVGKTCILVSYTQNRFPDIYEPTVFDNFSSTVKVDGKIVSLGLWDTAGQEQYNRLRPLAYPHCDVFLICFSVIDPVSFQNAKKKWYVELQELVPNAPKVFVGNKIDLRDEYTQKAGKDTKSAPISKEVGRKVIEDELRCRYLECSALSQQGLKEVFIEAIRIALKNKGTKKKEGKPPKQGSTCNGCQLI